MNILSNLFEIFAGETLPYMHIGKLSLFSILVVVVNHNNSNFTT